VRLLCSSGNTERYGVLMMDGYSMRSNLWPQAMSDRQNQLVQQQIVPGKRARAGYVVLAYCALLMGIVGVFLPLLPATPFLLVAVWAGSRGSQRVHDWIFEQPHFARLINDWREQGAIPRGAKWLATIMMIVSFLTLIWSGVHLSVLLVMGAFFSAVGGFLWTRPSS
jgi:uncharacterized membrane protein YbaN (DUF454 family)